MCDAKLLIYVDNIKDIKDVAITKIKLLSKKNCLF